MSGCKCCSATSTGCGSRASRETGHAYRSNCRNCTARWRRFHEPAFRGDNVNQVEESAGAWPVTGLPATLAHRTRRVYDRLAAVYPVSTMLFHSRAHRCALGASDIRDGMKVLEVATGSGEMFRRLVRANGLGTTIGVDLSPNMAARTQRAARRKFPSA